MMAGKTKSTKEEVPLHEVVLKTMFEVNKDKPAELSAGDVFWRLSDPSIREQQITEVLNWLVHKRKVDHYAGKYSLDRFEFLEQKKKNGKTTERKESGPAKTVKNTETVKPKRTVNRKTVKTKENTKSKTWLNIGLLFTVIVFFGYTCYILLFMTPSVTVPASNAQENEMARLRELTAPSASTDADKLGVLEERLNILQEAVLETSAQSMQKERERNVYNHLERTVNRLIFSNGIIMLIITIIVYRKD